MGLEEIRRNVIEGQLREVCGDGMGRSDGMERDGKIKRWRGS